MKYLLIFIAFLSIGGGVHAKDKTKKIWIQSSVPDASLTQAETKFSFVVLNAGIYASSKLVYQVDKSGQNLTATLTDQKIFSHTTGVGAHKFVISAGGTFKEIKARLKGKPGHHITVIINFKRKRVKKRRGPMYQVKKPIIYLYPEETIDVTVRLHPQGKLTFSYPEYQKNWKVTADPDGTLTHDQATYNYLFWESEQSFEKNLINQNEGFIITGENITAFLDKQLTEFGFTGKERADFVTFWAPQMQEEENLFVHFIVNAECNVFAELEITPTPDNISRFYMLWSPIDKHFDRSNIVPQKLPTMQRNGFTVLEWGGSEIDLNSQTAN